MGPQERVYSAVPGGVIRVGRHSWTSNASFLLHQEVESPHFPGPVGLPFLARGVLGRDVDPNAATAVEVYADDVSIGSATGPFPAGEATVTVTGPTNGQVVTATQTIGGTESCYSAPVVVAVPAPTANGPLDIDDTVVTVSDVHPLASAVRVYVGGGLAGTNADPNGADMVPVTVAPLEQGNVVQATQVIAGVESPLSSEVIVANFVVVNELSYDDRGVDEVSVSG